MLPIVLPTYVLYIHALLATLHHFPPFLFPFPSTDPSPKFIYKVCVCVGRVRVGEGDRFHDLLFLLSTPLT